jgi:hypothetical protein
VARPYALWALVLFVVAACLAHGQGDVPGDTIVWFHPNQEVRIRDLPTLTASSDKASVVLAVALETILHDNAVCCGKDSALEDEVLSDFPSLKDLGAKVEGRHLLSDGQPIMIHAEYAPQSSVNSGVNIVNALQDQHAALIEWKSHVYLLYGATFNETRYSSGRRQYAVSKLFCWTPDFPISAGSSNSTAKLMIGETSQGVLTLTVKRP